MHSSKKKKILGRFIDIINRITKFQSVYKLILHISAEEKDKIGISYIGLKGIRTNVSS